MDGQNKIISISLPGKTFVTGEYAVLKGAPALLVNTRPRFCFIAAPKGDSSFTPPCGFKKVRFHIDSPAGQLLKRAPDIQKNYVFWLKDPYSGGSGFGLSSAEFLFVYYLLNKNWDFKPMARTYRSLNFKGRPPSAADTASQSTGGVCVFDSQKFKAKSHGWPFKNLSFFLIRTGVGLNTWRHLQKPLFYSNGALLESSAKAAVEAFLKKDAALFTQAVKNYALALERLNLVHANTAYLLKKIRRGPVLAAKGSGALGAEVLFVLFDSKNQKHLKAFLKAENLNVTAGEGDLTV